MKKLSDYEKDLKDKIDSEIQAGQAGLPENWDGHIIENIKIDKYGLCNTCTKVRICKTKYHRVMAYCEQWERHLNEIDPVIECTNYKKRGQLSLFEMQNMAIIIELDKKKVGLL